MFKPPFHVSNYCSLLKRNLAGYYRDKRGPSLGLSIPTSDFVENPDVIRYIVMEEL